MASEPSHLGLAADYSIFYLFTIPLELPIAILRFSNKILTSVPAIQEVLIRQLPSLSSELGRNPFVNLYFHIRADYIISLRCPPLRL